MEILVNFDQITIDAILKEVDDKKDLNINYKTKYNSTYLTAIIENEEISDPISIIDTLVTRFGAHDIFSQSNNISSPALFSALHQKNSKVIEFLLNKKISDPAACGRYISHYSFKQNDDYGIYKKEFSIYSENLTASDTLLIDYHLLDRIQKLSVQQGESIKKLYDLMQKNKNNADESYNFAKDLQEFLKNKKIIINREHIYEDNSEDDLEEEQ